MEKLTGWLFDVYPNYEYNYMTFWLKLANGSKKVEQLSERFDPKFYVHGSRARLDELAKKLKTYPEIKNLNFAEWRIDISDPRKYHVLEVTMRDYRELKPFAAMIDREGKYSEFQLYNVDLRLSQKYMLRRGAFPLAHVSVDKELSVQDDDQFALDYSVPELKSVDLDIKVAKRGRVVRFDDPLGEARLGEATLENCGSTDESELLLGIVNSIEELDPDVIFTKGGDSFVVPYLYHRAEVNELNDRFQLGRESDRVFSNHVPILHDDGTYTRPNRRSGKSYFTYGQIRYKPPFYAFKGRIHIDKTSSFIFLESGLYGLIELARISGIPLQTMSRLSPGTAISSMQTSQALRDGVLIRWKKNIPESFKDAKTLLLADRGGHIFDPLSGVHENVLEIDFASLYPNIISIKNISPETVMCRCCANDSKVPVVPSTNYHVCHRIRGLIPRVIERILERRVVHKSRKRGEYDMHDQRQKVLKWVLVTCFGYTGYRNARFGRIECHESITAYAREILLDAMEVAEEKEYRILHGIVDSLWVTLNGHDSSDASASAPGDGFEALCNAIAERTGVNIEFEGYYRWIVFLPNKSTGAGALTRYYGLLDSGEFKVRGVELRQRSTPKLFIQFQQELLNTLASVRTKQELKRMVKDEVFYVIKKYARDIMSGACDPHKLVFANRVTRSAEEYRVFNNQVAALMQLNREGVEVHPGETVHYVILNHNTRDPDKRVRVVELMEGSEQYDKAEYLKYLCRTAESLLRPFGITEEKLLDDLGKGVQSKL
jgi:DNA polymerase elongation subunit (family B)